MRAAIGVVVVALACGVPSVARAQDGPAPRHHHCPSCGAKIPVDRCEACGPGKGVADEDRELDRVLRREYGDPNGPAPRRRIQTPPPEPVPPPAPMTRVRSAPKDDDDEFFFHLGVFGAHWAARLSNVSISSGRGGFHGDHVSLSGGRSSAADLDGWSQTQMFRGWIDLGPWFSFDGGANRSWFRETGRSNRDFVFRGQQFVAGQNLETKFEALIADFNFVVHPIHGACGHFDILLGVRYLYSNSGFTAAGPGGGPGPPIVFFSPGGVPFIPINTGPVGPPPSQTQRSEALIPMVGLGGTLRPVHTKEVTLEVFARARVGGFDWEERGYSYRRHRFIDRSFYAYSAELDGGVSLILFQTIGVTAGYHFDAAYIERRDQGESESARWNAHGPYGGVFVQF